MPVKPEVRQLLDLINAASTVPIASQSPAEVRTGFDRLASHSGEPVASIVDTRIDGVHGSFGVRVYRPHGTAEEDVLPGLLWFHGGGFVLGNLGTADSTCRSLANLAEVTVVSVDYHLAPEHPFPIAVDDAVEAFRWTTEHAEELSIDAGRIGVGGDSAGGNLAAVVSQLAKAAHLTQPVFQLLVYPVVDFDGSYPSMQENANGYFLEAATMSWFLSHYLGGRDRSNPRVSPIRSSDLSGLPPALVVTAEFDPLRDEGEAYAHALQRAGVDVELVRYDGLIHGFFDMDHLPDCAVARAHAAASLRAAFDAASAAPS